MPSRPPGTRFYKDNDNAELWRDVSRLFEDFVGDYPARIPRFEIVLRDILTKLNDDPRAVLPLGLSAFTVNGVVVKCPQCGFAAPGTEGN